MYEYAATVQRVIDGDTLSLVVDLGFSLYRHGAFRLLGCNAIELSAPGGKEARDNLAKLLPVGSEVVLHTVKPDKYADRYDAAIVLHDGRDLTQALIEEGWAAPWDGRGARPTPPWPRVPSSV